MAASYTTFGNFLLLKQRSQDGLGSLWRSGEMERLGFKRIVWLRRFDPAGLDRTALAAEAALATQLATTFRSSNVVRNSTAGTEGGVPFVAWDYVPAQPLDQLLLRVAAEQFPVAIDNALLITEKLAAALAAGLGVEVRGEPLVHGFLIPQMVLVGNDGEAMAAGFGLSRGLLANLDRTAVQQMAAPYLAPEVLATASPSRRADVYSLGAILYQLLCGQPLPADPGARAAALTAPMMAFEEGPVPADVLAILQKALAVRPEERYGSAADLKRELEKLLYGGAYSPTTFNLALFMDRLYRHEIEEEDRELQREKSIDVTPFYRAPGEEKPAAPAAQAPPSRTGMYVAVAAVALLLGVVAYLLLGRPQQPAVNAEMIKQMVAAEMEGYKQREAELAKQLEDSLARERQYEEQIRAASSGKKQLTPEEQAKLDEQKRQAEQARQERLQREAELAKAQREREQAQRQAEARIAAASGVTMPTAAPTTPPRPTAVPTAAPTAVAVAPAARSTAPPAAPTSAPVEETAPPEPAAVPAALAVREGELVDFTTLDVAPQVLVEERPTLPRAAVMAKVNAAGVVILKVLVNERGSVDDAQVLRGFPVQRLGIDEACLDAARKYRFKPGVKDGVKVKTWTTVTMRIDLGGRSR